MAWFSIMICVVVFLAFVWTIVYALRHWSKPSPFKYILSKEGLPKPPWILIEVIGVREAQIIIPAGVGLKRVRDFLDGLTMCIAGEIGETLRNKILIPEERKYTTDRIETRCPVLLKGFRKEGETEIEAEMRLILEAEQRLNNLGDIRAHFE